MIVQLIISGITFFIILISGIWLSKLEVVKSSLVIVHKISSGVLLHSHTGWFFMALK